MKPRLKQPLFSVLEQAKLKTQFASDFGAANLIRLYDVLWNQFYMPDDMTIRDVEQNTLVTLEVLGSYIEVKCGEAAFEIPEQSPQLEFNLDTSDLKSE